MAYLIANPNQTVFQNRVHYFSSRPTGPRFVDSQTSRMAIASAPWAEIRELISNLGEMKIAAYVLAGAVFPEGIITRCYVGETVDILARINRHAADPQKSFVSEAYVIGSVDPSYDKTDVQLLQHRLNNEIERADRAYIVRGVRPALPQVDSARIAQGDRDFEDVQRLLPSIGCNILESREVNFPKTKGEREHQAKAHYFIQPRGDGPIRSSDRLVSDAEARSRTKNREATVTDLNPRGLAPRPALFVLAHAGFVAYGYQHGNEFIVLPGSQMRREPMRSFEEDIVNQQRRRDIINAGVVGKVKGYGDRWQLAQERRFPSRSIAAKVLMGVNLRNDAWAAVSTDNRPA
jgi:hypothetical protein